MVSVIIPTYDEGCNPDFEKILRNVVGQEGVQELIVVERAKRGQTESIVQKFIAKSIVNSRKSELRIMNYESRVKKIRFFHLPGNNRAEAMNFGLEKAQNEVVFFHHPASFLLNSRVFPQIKWLFEQHPQIVGGGFCQQFATEHLWLRFVSWYSNTIRARLRKIWYLDQGIFCRTKIARKIGGFPNIEINEEVGFCKRLQKAGKLLLIAEIMCTSAHKFLRNGVVRQSLKIVCIKLGLACGLSPKTLNQWYGRQ